MIAWAARYVPESRAEHPRRLDPVGQLLIVAGLGALTFAIIDGPRAGWTSVQTLGVFAFAALCLTTLVPYELRRREPLLEVRFFASAPLSGASAIAVLAFAGIGGFLFLNTLYLQNVRGFSPLHAGLELLVSYVLFGIGNGLTNPPITNTAVTGMPSLEAGWPGTSAGGLPPTRTRGGGSWSGWGRRSGCWPG